MHCMHTVQLLSAHGGGGTGQPLPAQCAHGEYRATFNLWCNLYLHMGGTGQPLPAQCEHGEYSATFNLWCNLHLHMGGTGQPLPAQCAHEEYVQPLTYGATFIYTWGEQCNLLTYGATFIYTWGVQKQGNL